MKTSSAGIELIKKHEGLSLKAYKCPAGVWTIGYGNTRGVNRWLKVTRPEVEVRLREDVSRVEVTMDKVWFLRKDLRQCQYDALISFVFNIGSGAFEGSTLRKKVVTDPDDKTIGDEFGRWVYASGVKMAGLVERREDEAALYFSYKENDL